MINQQIESEIRPRLANTIQSETLLQEQFPKLEVKGVVDGHNKRLAYQQGFFTEHVFFESLEVWAKRIAEVISHDRWNVPLTSRIVFDVSIDERARLLKTLDKMNINSRSLFPDIKGSVDYACFLGEHSHRWSPQTFSGTRSPERD